MLCQSAQEDGFSSSRMEELLSDPIFDLVLKADGLSREDVIQTLRSARARLTGDWDES